MTNLPIPGRCPTGPAVPPHLRALLAAIVEALDVPLADRPDDDAIEHRTMRERAIHARIIANSVLTSTYLSDVEQATAQLRRWTSESPVTYRSWKQRTGASAQDGQADDEPTSCGRCNRTFDLTDPRWNGHGQYAQTPWCRSCVDLCHSSELADHCCPICEPARYGGETR